MPKLSSVTIAYRRDEIFYEDVNLHRIRRAIRVLARSKPQVGNVMYDYMMFASFQANVVWHLQIDCAVRQLPSSWSPVSLQLDTMISIDGDASGHGRIYELSYKSPCSRRTKEEKPSGHGLYEARAMKQSCLSGVQ